MGQLENNCKPTQSFFQLLRQEREFLSFSFMLRDENKNFYHSTSCSKTSQEGEFFHSFPCFETRISFCQSRALRREREKSKKPSESTTFMKYGIFGWFFGFFSSLVCPIELILFPLLLHFSPDSVWYPYIKFTTTLFAL